MPIHDWTRVDAGIFHDFHHSWVIEIKRAFNQGVLPSDYYALTEQETTYPEPDALIVQEPLASLPSRESLGRVFDLATSPPQIDFRSRAESPLYANKTSAIAIRHRSGHQVIAMLEIVSPRNKNSLSGLRAFVEKAVEMFKAGIHLSVVDLFPPGPRDPQGIHKAIWDEVIEEEFTLPEGEPLTLAAYAASECPEAFVKLVAVGDPLPDMPLFLTPDVYVPVPLETTYQAAWEAVPAFWRDRLTSPST
jgi:hypothetical protein